MGGRTALRQYQTFLKVSFWDPSRTLTARSKSCRLDDMVPLRYLNSRVMLQDIAPFIVESREKVAVTGGCLCLRSMERLIPARFE
jgi:hypothetical protein